MKDRDSNEPVNVSEWMDYIAEYAYEWEVGSPEHCAVSDFYNLHILYRNFGKERGRGLSEVSGKANLSREQRENLDLQRIALLEHTIELNQARMPGYSKANVEMTASFDHLHGAASEEAKVKFPNEVEKQKEHVMHIYDEALGDVFSSVFEKQNSIE